MIKIIYIACPLTIIGLANVALQFVNTILIPQRLMVSGYSASQAMAALGKVMGMAIPLIYLPYVVTSALVINIIPNLSADMTLKNYKNADNNINSAIGMGLLTCLPLTCIYLIFPQVLSTFIYNDPCSSRFIQPLGYSTIPLSLQHILYGILYGLNKEARATAHRLIGILIQVFITYILVDNPILHINGFFISFFISSIKICFLDIRLLSSEIGLNLVYSDLFFKPLLATSTMMSSIFLAHITGNKMGLPSNLICPFPILVGLTSYILVLVLLENLYSDL